MQIVDALGWILVHFLWQGGAVALALAGVLALLRGFDARVRYLASVVALVVMLALPLLTAWQGVGGLPASEGPIPVAAVGARAPNLSTATPVVREVGRATHLGGGWPASGALETARASLQPVLPTLVIAWLFGVAVCAVRLSGGWLLVQRLRREGSRHPDPRCQAIVDRLVRRLGIRRAVRVLESATARSPLVIGWLRPVVLLPTAALTGLAPAHVEAILAHELAHVRRHDFLVNWLQLLAETALFYHPAVWWVSGRIRREREHCCDDLGVLLCGNALTYARALTEMEGLRGRAPQLAMALGYGSLRHRIHRLFEVSVRPEPGRWSATGALLVAGLLTIVGIGFAQPPSGNVPTDASTPPRERVDSIASLTAEQIATLGALGIDPAFLEELRQRGDRTLPLERFRSWERHGVPADLLDELERLGIGETSISGLLDLIWYEVDGEFVRGLRELGYGQLEVAELVTLGRYGVDSEYIEVFRRLGYPTITLDELVDLGRYGVDGSYVEGLQRAGLTERTPKELSSLRRYDVDGPYVESLAALGYRDLTTDEWIACRRYGVDAELLRALERDRNELPTPDEAIEAARYGYEAN